MLRNRALLSSLIVIAAVLGLATYFWRSGNTGTSYEYATYADVKSDTSVQAATVPEFVPSSAKAIAGRYNVEFNTQTLEFAFATPDQDSMTRGFQKVDADEKNAVRERLKAYRWKEDLPTSSDAAAFLRRGPDNVEYLLIDAKRAYAHYAVERARQQ